ncbi:hypothetical protein [Streptomyces sp. NPDC002853]
MNTDAATGLLHLIAAEPTLLAVAPPGTPDEILLHRARDEHHPCLACGRPANCAVIVHSPAGDRVLDVCSPCWDTVRQANEASGQA